jgi:hypothetical protein
MIVQTVVVSVRQALPDLTSARELEVTFHLNNIATRYLKQTLKKKGIEAGNKGTEKEKGQNAIKKENKGKTITESKISGGKKELRNEY